MSFRKISPWEYRREGLIVKGRVQFGVLTRLLLHGFCKRLKDGYSLEAQSEWQPSLNAIVRDELTVHLRRLKMRICGYLLFFCGSK